VDAWQSSHLKALIDTSSLNHLCAAAIAAAYLAPAISPFERVKSKSKSGSSCSSDSRLGRQREQQNIGNCKPSAQT
jgi:hypothetical protein